MNSRWYRRPAGPQRLRGGERGCARASATQAQALDQRAVAGDVDGGDVLEQTTATTDEQQQAATRVVVVLVHLEVLGEVGDPLGEHGDLSFRRTGVGLVQAVLA